LATYVTRDSGRCAVGTRGDEKALRATRDFISVKRGRVYEVIDNKGACGGCFSKEPLRRASRVHRDGWKM